MLPDGNRNLLYRVSQFIEAKKLLIFLRKMYN